MTGKLVIVSGVSGSGKSSIVNIATKRGLSTRIITCTTRKPRQNNGVLEVDAVDYHFLSEEEFAKLVQADEFAEFENNYGRSYGTRKNDIAEALTLHEIAFAIVDTRGAQSLMRLYPDALSIFVHASKDVIRKRLELRGDNSESIERRLRDYDIENAQSQFFDKIIQNPNGLIHFHVAMLHLAIWLHK